MPRSASASRRSLKDLDPNFRKESGTDHLKWIDAFDRRIAMRGLGWLAENRRRRDFRRIPDRAAGALSEGVQILSHCPAGVYLSFGTDSPDLSVKVQLDGDEWLDNMPATGAGGVELYQRDGLTWCSVAVGSPSMKEQSYIRSLLKNAIREPGEYRLYLPLYRRVCSVAIGIARNARLTLPAAPVHPRPVVFYGTSITQGGCANTAGSDFVSLLGRRLDREMVNLGFSGNGKGEPELAELLAELDAEAFVLDYLANVDPQRLENTLPEFVDRLRDRRPATPIILMGNIPYDQSLWNRELLDLHDAKRHRLMEFYLARRAAGDSHLYFIDGHGLLPIGAPGIFSDGIHPSSHGFAIMAERLEPQFRRVLLWNSRENSARA